MKKITNSIKYFNNVTEKHNDIYNYHNDYTGAHNKIRITCEKHGDFHQKAYVHKQGSGCPECSGTTFNKDKAIKEINNKGYSILTKSFTKTSNIECKCSKGHLFVTSIHKLLNKNNECLTCSYDTRKQTKIKNGFQISDEMKSDFQVYSRLVWKLTNRTIKNNNIKDIDKRSREFHLDHKFSIYDGFANNALPIIIAHKSNLEIITKSENVRKNRSSNILLDEINFESSTTIPKGSTLEV